MIDLHSHILPGLDDGSPGIEESLEMLRMAAAAGTTDLAATPHANDRYAFHPAVVRRKLAELRQAAGDTPRLHYGCELHLTAENIAAVLRAPDDYTIGQAGYLLLEFADFQIPRNATEIFDRLREGGVQPVVAHPERNPLLQTQYRRLSEWVDRGCIVQVTAQSFTGRFGRSACASATELVKRRLVHVVASDAHDSKQRPPLLEGARRHVEKHHGAATANLLFLENPGSILAGRSVAQIPARRFWW